MLENRSWSPSRLPPSMMDAAWSVVDRSAERWSSLKSYVALYSFLARIVLCIQIDRREVVQRSAWKGNSYRCNVAILVIELTCLVYLSPIPLGGGGGGVFLRLLLPAFAMLKGWGGGGEAACGLLWAAWSSALIREKAWVYLRNNPAGNIWFERI